MSMARKTTPRVKNGVVAKKNRYDHHWETIEPRPRADGRVPIVVQSPIEGRHLLDGTELHRFVQLIPDWSRHRRGLRALVLGDGTSYADGWSDAGLICIEPWTYSYRPTLLHDYFDQHVSIFERLQLSWDHQEDGVRVCFDERSAKAYQLMHIFLHELGHHIDRERTRAREHCPGEEDFAEDFAFATADRMWTPFFRAFGW